MTENLKEIITERVLEIKDVDLGILNAYKQMPKEFQEKLSFESFYNFHRRKIEDYAEMDERNDEDKQKVVDGIIKGLLTDEDIKHQESLLCIRCKKAQKQLNDKDYCSECIKEQEQIAKKKTEGIKAELATDTIFQSITSETGAVAYIKDKYKQFQEENKFIRLPTIAKDVYNLKKIKR